MESIGSSTPQPIQVKELEKPLLQEICKGLNGHIKEYDYLILRQLTAKNKNYKKIVKLCERKQGLLASFKKNRNKLLN